MFERRMREIRERRGAIRELLDNATPEELTTLLAELDELAGEYDNLERQSEQRSAAIRTLETEQRGAEITNPIAENVAPAISGNVHVENRSTRYLADVQNISATEVEQRARDFASNGRMTIGTEVLERSLTIDTGTLAMPTRASGITPGQNEVSGILDFVSVVSASGMAQDNVSYQKTNQTAKTKKDGTATTASDATFGIAKITPTLVSTLSYISKFIEKTTPLNYQERVSQSAFNSLRSVVGKQIVTGDPSVAISEICGIIKADAIDAANDIALTAIDEKTLRNIVLAYGGDENIEGDGLLILSKNDLVAFGDIRGTNEKKAVYEIEFIPGSTTCGIIKDGGLAVKFVLNSACKETAKATAGDYTMVYGKGMAYQLDLFSDYTVEVSRDYKFAEGQLAILGEVLIGGNVIAHNGFTRVKKK